MTLASSMIDCAHVLTASTRLWIWRDLCATIKCTL